MSVWLDEARSYPSGVVATPHYLATPFDYGLFNDYFSTFVEQRNLGVWQDAAYPQPLPYTVSADVYGGYVIPENLGYVIEGHVPADQVKRLLADRPEHAGIAAPGMPAGSPGMDVPNSPPYEIVAWDRDGTRSRYAEVRP